MIAFITICYASLYILIFNKLGLLKKTVANICAFAGVGVVIIGAIVFMWYTFSPLSVDARNRKSRAWPNSPAKAPSRCCG